MCCHDHEKFESFLEAGRNASGRECRPHDEALRKDGRLIVQGYLAAVQSSKVLPVGSGKPWMSDGPYAETKEHAGAQVERLVRGGSGSRRLDNPSPGLPAREGLK
jgi:hypothetical protein